MEKRTFTFDYLHYDSLDDLPDKDRKLVERALHACGEAYAPYSGFRVGAAARLVNGSVFSANNQESEVFSSGMCAERILLYYIQANGNREAIDTLAIVSMPGERECYPCGACRQVLIDTEKRQHRPIRLILCSDHSATVIEAAHLLLPMAFEL